MTAAGLPLVAALISLVAVGDSRGTGDLGRRWQGAWVVRDADYPGSVQAWNVRGDRVLVYDPMRRRTEAERLAFVSPCRLQRTRVLPDRSEIATYDTFVFGDDGLHIAPAPASGGFRVGDLVTACIGDDVYEYDLKTRSCWLRQDAATAPPETPDAECAIVSDGVTTSFVVRPLEGGTSQRLDFYGRALLSNALLAHLAQRSSDFDAARARADRLEAR